MAETPGMTFDQWWGDKERRWSGVMDIREYSRFVWDQAQDPHIRGPVPAAPAGQEGDTRSADAARQEDESLEGGDYDFVSRALRGGAPCSHEESIVKAGEVICKECDQEMELVSVAEIDAMRAEIRHLKEREADLRNAIRAVLPDFKPRAWRADNATKKAPEDPHVLTLCQYFGFGAVIGSASRQWYRQDPVGAYVVNFAAGMEQAMRDKLMKAVGANDAMEDEQ